MPPEKSTWTGNAYCGGTKNKERLLSTREALNNLNEIEIRKMKFTDAKSL